MAAGGNKSQDCICISLEKSAVAGVLANSLNQPGVTGTFNTFAVEVWRSHPFITSHCYLLLGSHDDNHQHEGVSITYYKHTSYYLKISHYCYSELRSIISLALPTYVHLSHPTALLFWATELVTS